MGELHRLVEIHGREAAKQLVRVDERRLVDVAARIMEADDSEFGITYSGFCLTALPHKRLPDDEIWVKQGSRVTLQVEPGVPPGAKKRVGVPYGSRARMILLYLQTQAIKRDTRVIELGGSMQEWMSRMGIGTGGQQYKDVREQARRISLCKLTFFWPEGANGIGFENETIIKGGLMLGDTVADARQGNLWTEEVVLSELFFEELKSHGVPVSEAAVRALSNQSVSIDIYVWLAYRLHSLSKPIRVSWAALQEQFGGGYADPNNFRKRFIGALKSSLAVYQDARVEVVRGGLELYPSPSPIQPRLFAVKAPALIADQRRTR